MLGRTRSTYWKAADDPHRHTQKASAKKDIQAKNLLAVMQQCWPLHHQNALLNFLTFFFYPFNWSIPEGCFTSSRKKKITLHCNSCHSKVKCAFYPRETKSLYCSYLYICNLAALMFIKLKILFCNFFFIKCRPLTRWWPGFSTVTVLMLEIPLFFRCI